MKVTGKPSQNVNANAATAGVAKEEVLLVGQDIRYIKTSTPEFKKGHSFFASAR